MKRSPKRWAARAVLTELALAVGLCLGVAPDPGFAANETAAARAAEWPKVQGAAFALRNGNNTAPVLAFDGKGRDLMAFDCAPRGRGLLGSFFELVCDGGSFHAREAGPWVGRQVAKAGAFTLEAMLTPAEAAPKSSGVVLAFGDDKGEDVALLQDHSGLSLRLGGTRGLDLFAPEGGKPVHVLISCDQAKWAAYRDGRPVRSGTMPGVAPAWGERQIVMGAAWSGADPWRGRLEGIAIFARALTAGEAAAEAAAGEAMRAGRIPPPTIRFRGTLVRQAKTSGIEAIRPYTRSLTAAEYKVAKVLAGEWQEPTITVLHWMIMDRKRLPIADRNPGTEVELSVQPLQEQPQLRSCRRDELEDEIAAEVFYCESES